MNVGAYTFDEYKQLAENFHGYAAPGLLLGGYMVELAKEHLPEDTLFEALVETKKCLPDAVQLLTPCSAGNNWMQVVNLGRYAVSLYDKYTGKGVRVSLASKELQKYPEIAGWLLKTKTKAEQDSARLEDEIRRAGPSVCRVTPVQMKSRLLRKSHMENIVFCPVCDEAYPQKDGSICRGCQGEAACMMEEMPSSAGGPYDNPELQSRVLPVEEAVGMTISHDLTRIDPGVFKGPEFKAGHRIEAHDLCRLQQMGRFHVAVNESFDLPSDMVHENEAAELMAARMAGQGIEYSLPPQEGKIDLTAADDGLFCVDAARMQQFNMLDQVMVASRQDATIVTKGMRLAGTRIIPLHISRNDLGKALAVLSDKPIFSVLPMRRAKMGILVTGTEIFQGIIQDKFIPVMRAKAQQYGCDVVEAIIAPDSVTEITRAIEKIRQAGADVLVTTGGLSVDPDDVTRNALFAAGITQVVHGVPVLPGTMSVVGILPGDPPIQVIGVPACALYYKTTFFDLVFPRLLANRHIKKAEIARMGEGGYCLACRICTYPKCFFGK